MTFSDLHKLEIRTSAKKIIDIYDSILIQNPTNQEILQLENILFKAISELKQLIKI